MVTKIEDNDINKELKEFHFEKIEYPEESGFHFERFSYLVTTYKAFEQLTHKNVRKEV